MNTLYYGDDLKIFRDYTTDIFDMRVRERVGPKTRSASLTADPKEKGDDRRVHRPSDEESDCRIYRSPRERFPRKILVHFIEAHCLLAYGHENYERRSRQYAQTSFDSRRF